MNKDDLFHVEPERHAANNIETLRNDLKLSYGELAKRMGQVGCPMDKSSLQKIEKGSPRRKISVNELVAFAEVFNVPVTSLIGGTADNEGDLAWRDLMNAESLANVLRVANAEYRGHVMDLQRLADRNPSFREQVNKRYEQHRRIILEKAKREAESEGYTVETADDLADYLILWDHDTAVTTTARDILGIKGMLGVDDNGE